MLPNALAAELARFTSWVELFKAFETGLPSPLNGSPAATQENAMMRQLTLATAMVFLLPSTVIAAEPLARLSVVVPDDVTAALLPPLPKEAKLGVLVHDASEPMEATHSRAFKLRFATHFVYCSGSESTLTAIYRERLQNHGAVAIDLRSLSPSELTALLKPVRLLKPQSTGGRTFAHLFPQD